MTVQRSAYPVPTAIASAPSSRHGRGRAGQSIVDRLLSAESRRKTGRAEGGKRGARKKNTGLLSEAELAALEKTFAEGVTAAQVVTIFTDRELRFSEATFRKYVQKALVPRSRRVGRKGKHRGSLGVYPAKTIRRVNAIKRLMGEGHTIEEIQDRFLRYTDLLEGLEEQVEDILSRFSSDLETGAERFDTKARRSLSKEIAEAQKSADDLVRRVNKLSVQLSEPRGEDLGPAGAAGSAEDLL